MTDEEKNSIVDIKKFLEKDAEPFAEGEFQDFWSSLSDEEKAEFKKTELPK